MQKKLLIYETTHYETLPALVELAVEHFDQISIFASTPSVFEDCRQFPVFENNNIQWTIKRTAESNREFIKKIFAELSAGSYSHFFINSIDHNLLYIAGKLLFTNRALHTVLNIHCIHDYTRFRFNTTLSISESMAKKILHRNIKHHRVLAPAMPSYLKSFLKNVEVEYIPGMFFRRFGEIDFSRKPFRIVVPGAVEKKRRHYEIIPAVVNMLGKTRKEEQVIELIILGNSDTPYGRELRKNIRESIEGLPVTLTTFDTEVSYDIFSAYYSSSHIIWSPVRLKMESIRGIEEINGLSNSAGLIVDFVHYARPVLMPTDIRISEKFDPLFFTYSGPEEAAAILNNFVNNADSLYQRNKDIRAVCSPYNIDMFRDTFRRLMNL
jgi:hypothetical protein